MTARPLTDMEKAVLNHKVESAEAWWAHVCAMPAMFPDPEAVLASKVARWRPEYEQAVATQGVNYKPAALVRGPDA